MKLTVKYLMVFVFTAITPIAILSYMNYGSARQALKKQVLDDLNLIAEMKEGHLYSFMETIKGRALDFSSDGFIRDGTGMLQKFHEKNHRYSKVQNALCSHLKRNKKPLDKTIELIAVVGLDGRIIASTDGEIIGQDDSKNSYFSEGLKGVYISDAQISRPIQNAERYHIAVAAPLTHKRTGALLGVMVNFYNMHELNKVLSGEFQIERGAPFFDLGAKKTLDIYLVNREKLLTTPSRFNGNVFQQRVETLPVTEGIAGREMVGFYKNYLGNEVIGASMYVPSMGWILVAEMGTHEAFLPIKVLGNRAFLLGVPVAILAFALAYVLSREAQGAIRESEENIRKLSHAVEQSSNTIVITDAKGRIEYANPKFAQHTGYKTEEVIGKNPRVLKSGKTPAEVYKRLWETITAGGEWRGEFCNKRKNGDLYWEAASISPVKNAEGTITHFIAIKEDITKRKEMERYRRTEHAITRMLAESPNLEETSSGIIQAVCEGLEWDFGEFWVVDYQQNALRCAEIWHLPSLQVAEFKDVTRKTTFSPGIGLPGRIWSQGEPVWVSDVVHDGNFPRASFAARDGLHGAFGFPLPGKGEILGVMVFLSREIRQPDEDMLNMMAAIGGQIGLFLTRRRAEERIRIQLQRLSALHEIDKAIAGTLDISVSLHVFLEKVVTQMEVDAACVLLFNTHLQVLEYAAGLGFRTEMIKESCIRMGEGTVGQVVIEQSVITIPDLRKAGAAFIRGKLVDAEKFVAYYCKPLIAKGEIRGVLEIFHRSPLAFDQERQHFLTILAGQGAIAIDHALLLSDLRRSNMELAMAYDRTIEGWSRALDMRDEETEGHTQRVAEMTLRLARKMGISDGELAHVRRGALLHDMGKMGIPDTILLKPGPLTDAEWEVMRRHPEYAYAMLSPIAFLHRAVDIPYCHHERWDGTGYPRGLREEQIPLAARIFAVVDVWDALCFDRPYRKGWPEEKVREHIRSCSGTHFDSKVVEAFLEMRKD